MLKQYGMKHYVMPTHTSNGATVCTPDGFAMAQLKELYEHNKAIALGGNKTCC